MNEVLLVIDVQNEYFTGAFPVTYPEHSFDQIKKAVTAAKDHQIPVVFIQHCNPSDSAPAFKAGSEGYLIHPELQQLGADAVFEKNFPSSLYKTGLQKFLDDHKIDTITICGYMTQMCCDTTARHAAHLGYHVNFLSDSTGTLDFTTDQGTISAEQLHKAVLITQSAFFSKVRTTADWISQLS